LYVSNFVLAVDARVSDASNFFRMFSPQSTCTAGTESLWVLTDGAFYRCQNRKFLDKVRIRVKAGDGGNGCASFERSIHGVGGPDGGNGGSGGDIYLETDEHCGDLSFQTYHFSGVRGVHGTSALCHGRRGDDSVIRVPPGTVVREVFEGESGASLRNAEVRTIADLAGHSHKLLAAKGGI
jgi:GTP-binding protein